MDKDGMKFKKKIFYYFHHEFQLRHQLNILFILKECRKTLLSNQQIIDDDMSRCDQLLSEDPNLTPVEDSKNSLVLIQARLQKSY